jgi:hypothetical protein
VAQLQSDTQIVAGVASDIITLTSDIAAAEAGITTIESDLVVAASNILITKTLVTAVLSDSLSAAKIESDTLSAATKILSDTSAIHTGIQRAGMPVALYTALADAALANNTQGAGGCIATASGNVLITDITIAKDGTALTGPTNVEFTCSNVAYGPTGADGVLAAVAVSTITANTKQAGSAFAVTAFKPVVLESNRKLYMHGNNAAGTSAGNIAVTILGIALADGATLA